MAAHLDARDCFSQRTAVLNPYVGDYVSGSTALSSLLPQRPIQGPNGAVGDLLRRVIEMFALRR